MHTHPIYRITRVSLILLAVLGLAAVLLVRPPSEAAGPRVVEAVELTGRIRQLVDEAAVASLEAVQLTDQNSQQDYDQSRAWLTAIDRAVERLSTRALEADRTWVPVEEATVLLDESRQLVRLTLARLPQRPIPLHETAQADPLETDPDRVGITPENEALIEEQVRGVKARSQQIRVLVEQAVLMTSLSRESLAGFELKWILLLLLTLAGLAGASVVWRAEQLLQIPPLKALETQLRLASHVDPRQAVDSSHLHSRHLLDLADEIVTVMRLSGSHRPSQDAMTHTQEADQ